MKDNRYFTYQFICNSFKIEELGPPAVVTPYCLGKIYFFFLFEIKSHILPAKRSFSYRTHGEVLIISTIIQQKPRVFAIKDEIYYKRSKGATWNTQYFPLGKFSTELSV